jgi:hypothetical protein
MVRRRGRIVTRSQIAGLVVGGSVEGALGREGDQVGVTRRRSPEGIGPTMYVLRSNDQSWYPRVVMRRA